MGWHWAVEIARLGHRVHILTRANNLERIEREIKLCRGLELAVTGYDLPGWARWWKKGSRGIRLYYLLWQWGAYRCARRLHRGERFDLVHHITFAVFRHPSFMGRLGIPFVFGPVGGGEFAPAELRRSLALRSRVAEAARAAANRLAAFDPLVRATLRSAALVFYKTPETLRQIPGKFHAKCICMQDVACDTAALAAEPALSAEPRFIYAGRLLYWKGIHLALKALAELRHEMPGARLTVAGSGPDEGWLRELSGRLRIAGAVEWLGWLDHAKTIELFARHRALVFPSLHDSGGTVVMEAMARGLPVICLDLGGPGAILPPDCGIKIAAHGQSESQVVAGLAGAMKLLATGDEPCREMAANALAAARLRTWQAIVQGAYREIEKLTAAEKRTQ